MTPEQLKASILQYAIQGKLVEQRPEEGTGEELYKKIQEVKQKLAKEGESFRNKKYPMITEDEKAYDIPETWIWVRLNDIVFNHGQKTPDATFSYIDIGSIDNKKQQLNDEENFIEASRAPSRARKIVRDGDILYSTVRPYLHNMCIVDNRFTCDPIASTGFAVMACCDGVYNKYLFYYLLSPWFDAYANDTSNSKGVAYPAINDDKLYKAVVPIPPLGEQKRIVAKIEELLPYVERYAAAYEKLEQLNVKFPEQIKKSILQYAIQGKLVEQRPEEGTGEELYHQIQEEKQRLIKEGKIKKEKLLPEIKDDEITFEIPESWKWVRLGNVGSWSAGATPSRTNPAYFGGIIPWLKTGDLNDGYIREVPEYITDLALEKTSLRINPVGSVLMAMYGATIGKLGILDIQAATNQACCACIPTTGMNNKYLFYYLMSIRSVYIEMADGGAQPNISKEKIVNSLIPLPPLAEQKRIVAKIEELLLHWDRLKKIGI